MGRAETNIRKAFQIMREIAANPDSYPDKFVAVPLEPDIVASIFTPERIRLLMLVREEGPYESLDALARAVHRDGAAVSRDLRILTEAGLVASRRRGRSKQIHGTRRPIVLK